MNKHWYCEQCNAYPDKVKYVSTNELIDEWDETLKQYVEVGNEDYDCHRVCFDCGEPVQFIEQENDCDKDNDFMG